MSPRIGSGTVTAHNRRPVRAGFTLVELLVVLMIIGVASAVAVPSFARIMRGGASDAARDLVSAFHAARDAAVTRAVNATVTVEMVSGRYWVIAGASTTGPDTLRVGTARREPQVRLAGGANGWATTTYDLLGRARGQGISISDGEETYEISADSWTGAVSTRRR